MLSLPFVAYPLDELIAYAREHAPFYRELYAGSSARPHLVDLPIVDQAEFWQAHQQDRGSVLSAPLTNGIVFNSGGTTGAPKYSYFDKEEWNSIICLSARTFEAAGLRDGDRVANLFASGNLYASFIFATESMKWTRPNVLQLPLGFSPNLAPAAAIIQEFKANVFAGFPTHLLRLIEHMDQEKMDSLHLNRIIYGGELFSQDQQQFLTRRFPGLEIRSGGYASVDAGLIGYADAGCTAGEHRVFDGAMIMEIVDEATDDPIQEAGQPGRILFTSLVRRLMPLLRYPTGDRAHWVEPAGTTDRKFQLLGRSQESARISHYTLEVSEAAALLEPFRRRFGIEGFQLLVRRENLLDGLVFRIASTHPPEVLAVGTDEILAAFRHLRRDISERVTVGSMLAPQVEWIKQSDLLVSPRTGKMLRVVDRRDG